MNNIFDEDFLESDDELYDEDTEDSDEIESEDETEDLAEMYSPHIIKELPASMKKRGITSMLITKNDGKKILFS
jgi:hypothetical protein